MARKKKPQVAALDDRAAQETSRPLSPPIASTFVSRHRARERRLARRERHRRQAQEAIAASKRSRALAAPTGALDMTLIFDADGHLSSVNTCQEDHSMHEPGRVTR